MRTINEGVDFDNVAEKIVAIIKGNGYNVILFTDEGMETTNPSEARRFYVKKPNFMITLDSENNVVRINKNSSIPLEAMESIMKQLRNMNRTYMLNTEVKVFGKEIAPKDFAYQAKRLKKDNENKVTEASYRPPGHVVFLPTNKGVVKMVIGSPDPQEAVELAVQRATKKGFDASRALEINWIMTKGDDGRTHLHAKGSITEASLSNLRGTKKTSYQTLESVRLVVRHRKPVDEDVRGSRARQIKEIFLQRADEVYRFPHNNLAGARAMARHLYEGGAFDDAIGNYIVETVANMIKLNEFIRYSRSNKLINEQSEDVIRVVRENIDAYKAELTRFSGSKTYHVMKEQVTARAGAPLAAVETNDIRDMFTVRKFDETQAAALPLIKQLVTEKNAWRSRIEEASITPFAVTSTEDLLEGGVLEFSSPQQKLGYKIRNLAERAINQTELVEFVTETADKLINGQDITKFESSIIRNVLGHIIVSEQEVAQPVDALEQINEAFERKMKLLEYGMDWDPEAPLDSRDYDDETGPAPVCTSCKGSGTMTQATGISVKNVPCKKCGGSGKLYENALNEWDERIHTSNYNPDGRTFDYKGKRAIMPDVSVKDIYSKSRAVPAKFDKDEDYAEDSLMQGIDKEDLRNMVTKALSGLSDRERFILTKRFGLDGEEEMSLDEIAEILGISGGRVRQIEAKSLRKLRHPSRSDKLGVFLGRDPVLKLGEAKEYDNEAEYNKAYAEWKSRNPSDLSAYGGEEPPRMKKKAPPSDDKSSGDSDAWASIASLL